MEKFWLRGHLGSTLCSDVSELYITWLENRLRVFENRVLRTIFGTEGERSDRGLERAAY
jgi:hypothetical protein